MNPRRFASNQWMLYSSQFYGGDGVYIVVDCHTMTEEERQLLIDRGSSLADREYTILAIRSDRFKEWENGGCCTGYVVEEQEVDV